MKGADLIAILQDPAVREPVQRLLGLPSEPVAEALKELSTAQRATEAAVKELAAAQKATDATVKELAAAVKELAVAQKATDAAVKELAVAQKATDATVKELAVAQKATDAAVKELTVAQKATDAAVKELTDAMKATRQEIGKLADNIGFGLEELAAIVLPDVLGRELGVTVGRFEPRYVTTTEGEEEIDLWASGVGPEGRPVTVVCEVKSRIYGQDVRAFRRKVDRLPADLATHPVAVMFGFRVHPSARAIARELEVRVWASVPQAA